MEILFSGRQTILQFKLNLTLFLTNMKAVTSRK